MLLAEGKTMLLNKPKEANYENKARPKVPVT
jgi:hypothetical protein